MPIYHTHFEQRSAEWFKVRAGIPTASEIDKIITPGGKLCKSDTSRRYMNRLLAEWVLGEPIVNEYENDYMVNGRENEGAAVQAFEFQTGLKTSVVGFVTREDGMVGCSPDRLVEDSGTLEIKVPAPQTQISYLLDGSVAEEYRIQAQSQLWICERDKSWVSSWHPKLPPVILEVTRDEALIFQIAVAVDMFIGMMLEKRLRLEKQYGPFVRPEPRWPVKVYDEFEITDKDIAFFMGAAND